MQAFVLVSIFVSSTALRLRPSVDWLDSPTLGNGDMLLIQGGPKTDQTNNKLLPNTSEYAYGTELAHVHVINLDNRLDKCHCMQAHLGNSSFPMFRQKAATNSTQECPTLKQQTRGKRRNALFCSNYLIWEKVSKMQNPPKFIIILEDDVFFKKDWEQHVTDFLSSDCADQTWDFVGVDQFYSPPGGEGTCTMGSKTIKLGYRHGAGTHMMIYRTERLPKFLKATHTSTFDGGWYTELGLKGRFWGPRMVVQATKKIGLTDPEQKQHIEECGRSMKKSDVDVWSDRGMSDGMSSNKVHRLPCPMDDTQ